MSSRQLWTFDDKQVEDLSHWIHYRGYYKFDDMYDTFHHNLEDVHKCEEHKWNGVRLHQPQHSTESLSQKLHPMDEYER